MTFWLQATEGQTSSHGNAAFYSKTRHSTFKNEVDSLHFALLQLAQLHLKIILVDIHVTTM